MSRQVIINLDRNTVTALNRNNYSLCCFLASESASFRSGHVLCWNVIGSFFNTVQITVMHKFSSFVSSSCISKNSKIFIPAPIDLNGDFLSSVSASNYKIKLQQQMIIGPFNGVTIKENNGANNITLSSQSKTAFSAGICVSDGLFNYGGICAFTLYQTSPLSILPIKEIFLMMIPGHSIAVNSVVKKSPYDGILIDLHGAPNKTRTLGYDINAGWSYSSSWAEEYKSQTDLSGLLIREPLSKRR